MDAKRRARKKRIIMTIVIVAAVILLIFAVKLYLTANLLLGNDLIIKLSSDKENLFLQHGQSEKIRFESHVLTNPFCSADCSYEFEDLSRARVVEAGTFEIKPILTESREYTLNASEIGAGQEIYRFSMACKSAKTFLCQTKEIPRAKSILITLNYNLTDEEQRFKQDSKENILALMQDLNYLGEDIDNADSIIKNLNKTVVADPLTEESEGIHSGILAANESDYRMKSLWEAQEYIFPEELNKTKGDISALKDRFEELNETLDSDISVYNGLIETLTSINQNLTAMKQINVSNTTVIEINNTILHFNDLLDTFNKRDDLADKKSLIKKMSREIKDAWEIIETDSEVPCCFANETIDEVNISRIAMNATNHSEINVSFREPAAMCCLFGECEECCTEDCSSENYPVILLHGHDFNRKASAEYSLYTFQNIQNALENESYLNAGSIIISPADNRSEGILGRINYPATFTASYYFDIYKNKEESEVIQTKTDSIDSYAIRLKDIIDVVKYKTGKDKVIIVSHSMGGVVARRYVQIFGSNDVDRLILIATPNNGLEGNTLTICPLFGSEIECHDLDKNSLLMNKLNYGEIPEIPIYNIIGVGCAMDSETGDGIVKNSSAYLKGAENYYVNGTCEALKLVYLHGGLLDPAKYPKAYELILGSLRR
jgi:predicted alpha/beta hydrolase family esterase